MSDPISALTKWIGLLFFTIHCRSINELDFCQKHPELTGTTSTVGGENRNILSEKLLSFIRDHDWRYDDYKYHLLSPSIMSRICRKIANVGVREETSSRLILHDLDENLALFFNDYFAQLDIRGAFIVTHDIRSSWKRSMYKIATQYLYIVRFEIFFSTTVMRICSKWRWISCSIIDAQKALAAVPPTIKQDHRLAFIFMSELDLQQNAFSKVNNSKWHA